MRKKFLSWLLTITMILPLFGGIPISLPASAVEVAEIPNGDYTISADCVYRLVSGYSGLVTINPSAKNVTLIGSGDASANSAAVKVAAGRSDGLALTIQDLKMVNGTGNAGVDFSAAPGFNHSLKVSGTCSVSGGWYAGILLGSGVSLTIDKVTSDAADQLTVGSSNNSGIGGNGAAIPGGALTINGGTITVSCAYGPGIGGTNSSTAINGGVIQSSVIYSGAGIGGDNSAVTINNGSVTAASGTGAGIGGSEGSKAGNTVTIYAGSINASSSSGSSTAANGAGIGDGASGSGTNVTINSGIISASCYCGNAGIGGTSGSVTITGGTIDSTATLYGAGIGGAGETVNISGGTVTAKGLCYGGAGIGCAGGAVTTSTITVAGTPAIIASNNSGSSYLGNNATAGSSSTLKDGSGSNLTYLRFHVTDGANDITGASVAVGGHTYSTNASGVTGCVAKQSDGTAAYSVSKSGYQTTSGTTSNFLTTPLMNLDVPVTLNAQPPSASGVGATGNAKVGDTLTGHYTYNTGTDGDAESGTTFRWLKNAGSEVTVYSNENVGGVSNGPSQPTVFTLSGDTMISYVQTYHWNNGSGTGTAGTISLRDQDGHIHGPWQAAGLAGYMGVPCAYWRAYVYSTLPAGTYTVIDSDPSTWSQNYESSYQGFVLVRTTDHSGAYAPITGAEGQTYSLTDDDLGSLIQLEVTVKDSKGHTGDPVSSSAVGPVGPRAAAPVLQSAATNTAGTAVTLTFDQAMADPSGKQGQFTVNCNGTALTVTAAPPDADTSKIDLTLGTAVAYGDTVTVSYTKGTVASSEGQLLNSFTAQTVTNHAVFNSPGNAAVFTSGSNTFIGVPDSSSLDATGALTIGAWIKPDGGGEWALIAGKQYNTSDANPWYAYRLYAGSMDSGEKGFPRKIAFNVSTDGTNEVGVYSNTVVQNNVWAHVAGVYDGTELKIYINGVLENTVPHTGSISVSDLPLFIGKAPWTNYNNFNGQMDEVRVWRTARTAQQIAYDMRHRLLGTESGLAGCWSFGEACGTIAVDSSANVNDGRLYNGAYFTASDAPIGAPYVTTGSVSNIAETAATFSGTVTSEGLSGVTERGFVYGAAEYPTLADTKIVSGNGAGAFSEAVTGLSGSIPYHVRAYAKNAVGTVYGEDVTFTTETAPSVCEIAGGSQYTDLGGALAAVTNGGTIKLLTDVVYNSGISASSKSFTINLDGKTLTVNVSASHGIATGDGSTISVAGTGALNVNVSGSGSNYGLYACTGSAVTAAATVTTTVTASGSSDFGVVAESGGTVIMSGSVTAPNSSSADGVYANGVGSSILITGNVSGGWIGACTVNGTVSITGDVTTGYEGSGRGVSSDGGTISVTGNVSATGGGNYGAYADNGGTITVTGNVTSGSVGASVYNSSKITIDGAITAAYAYIQMGSYGNYMSAGNYAATTTKADYLTYTDGTNTVWVKEVSQNWTNGITSSTQYPFGGGDGTSAAQAYEISTAQQLAQLAYNVNQGNSYSGKYFKLVADIDLAGKDWTPIGYRYYPGYERGFDGTFDGNGYIIGNLAIGSTAKPKTGGEQTQAGLFGAIKYNAVLKDINIDGAKIYTDSVTSVGALVGYSESEETVSGCAVSGAIVSAGSGDLRIGGLVGDSSGASILNCSSAVNVTAAGGTAIGGVVGYPGSFSASEPREISGCTFAGSVNAGNVPSYGGVGGIAGKSYGYLAIVNSVNKGAVSGANGNIGGITGFQHNDVINCYSSGTVSGSGNYPPTCIGGITGYLDSGSVYNCYDSGRVSTAGTALVGALAGYGNSYTTVSNGYFDEAVNPDLAHVRSTAGNKYYLYSFTTDKMKGADPGINVSYAEGVYSSGEGAFKAALNGWITVQTAYPGIEFAQWETKSTLNSGYPYLVGVDYPAGTDATLSALSASGITLSPAFGSGITSYSADAANSVSTTTVTAEPTDSHATVAINGTKGTSEEVALSVGSNTVTVQVTAENGTTTKTYTIIIDRASGGSSGGGGSWSPAGKEIDITTPDGMTTVKGTLTDISGGTQVGIDGVSFGKMAAADKKVMINTGRATVTFDPKAMDYISGKAGSGDVVLAVKKIDSSTLPEQAKKRIGDRPVYNFSVTAGGVQTSSFGGGHADISVPYTLKAGENPHAVIVCYIDDSGNLKTVRGTYNAATGTVKFRVSHFSEYAVGYNEVTFSDVTKDAWYKDAVDFIAARGITNGMGNNKFGPDENLTRGQFVVMLLNAYGISPDRKSEFSGVSPFGDAGNAYYTDYLLVAKGLGIVNGVGNNQFTPEKEISRQEMFVMLYNALKAFDELPAATGGRKLSDFSDAGQAASWAQDALKALLGSGVISGSGGKLSPAATTTRAEMAQVMYNLLSK